MSNPNENKLCVFVQGIEATFLVVAVADSDETFKSTTIKSFKQMVHEKRPEIELDCMRLLFAGTQLVDSKDDGSAATFEHYKIKKNSTLHLVIRVHGGSTKRRDEVERPASPEGKMHDPNDFALKFTSKPDCIDPFPDPNAPLRVEMTCGHAVDPNTLTAYCRSLVDDGQYEMRCPGIVDKKTNKKCNKIWEYTEVRQIALLNDAECQWFESKIAERAALLYCDMKECPKCRSFVERGDLTNLRVHCTICTKKTGTNYDFCWQCLHADGWTGPTTSSVKCGRADCIHPDIPKVRDAPMMKVAGADVPNRRACPTCGNVVEHKGTGCKNVSCTRCKVEFCFLCLELTADCSRTAPSSWFGSCKKPVAPKQTIIPVWHR